MGTVAKDCSAYPKRISLYHKGPPPKKKDDTWEHLAYPVTSCRGMRLGYV